MNFCKFVAFSFLLRTQMVHLEVSFIIYSALSMPSFAVHFVTTFERLAKTFQLTKKQCVIPENIHTPPMDGYSD